MKIVFTGGGTGGHFYPIIAVVEALEEKVKNEKIIEPELHFMSSSEYDARALYDHGIIFHKITAGKVRGYFSILNFFDLFKTLNGIFGAILEMYSIYPDVVFSKGGYCSFPPLLAARLLGIPVVIHDSDTVPGRVSIWSGKFAKKIAVSWPDAAKYFPAKKVAWTGNPMRQNIATPLKNGAHEYLKLRKDIPTILIIGGSQGSQKINENIVSILPELVKKYQVIHQTGINNYKELKGIADVVLNNNPDAGRYMPFEYLNELALRMSAGAADLVISRAGSSIFEIAAWGVPSIIIPIPEEISHDQKTNAVAYARTGSCNLIEEKNLTPHILLAEIDRMLENKEMLKNMAESATKFAKKDAAEKVANAILDIALEHEAA